MSFTRVVYRRLRGEAWPEVIRMYKLRQCPECGCLVHDWGGQEVHEAWHQGSDDDEYDDESRADGYVIGDGPLPVELRGEDDERRDKRGGSG